MPPQDPSVPAAGPRRVEFETPVSIRFPHFERFVDEYARNVSITGMFLRWRRPATPGSQFNFEFKITDDWELIRGRAEVVWVRDADEGPDRPAGMGVRFVSLAPESRRLIRWLVERNQRAGGQPFTLDPPRRNGVETPVAALPPAARRSSGVHAAPTVSRKKAPARTPAGETAAAAAPRARARTTLVVVGLLLALSAAVYWLAGGDGERVRPAVGPNRSPAVDPRTAADPRTADEADASAPPAGPVEPEPPLRTVTSWARAWSDGDADAYLSHYSLAFQPPAGLSRDEWQARWRARIAAERHVRVAITAFEQEPVAPDRLRVTFNQSYRSDERTEVVRKVMELVLEEGRWLIADERTVG